MCDFKDVMARFPTGVTIATTCDEGGSPHGLTVSSFCPVSLDPPLVLVCVAKSATSYPVFAQTEEFAVSILRENHAELALRCANSGARKFGGGEFVRTARGGVVVDNPLAAIECRVDQVHDAGDHIILVGQVVDQFLSDAGSPAVYFQRQFAALSSAQ
ncbi:flavin reductase family protein [Streptomyces kronopolitis]|uniref:flavin reductase family protein n=1 Tax=Streptomyces kronopolitis TaxID=1612435 RepID=UPI003D953842